MSEFSKESGTKAEARISFTDQTLDAKPPTSNFYGLLSKRITLFFHRIIYSSLLIFLASTEIWQLHTVIENGVCEL